MSRRENRGAFTWVGIILILLAVVGALNYPARARADVPPPPPQTLSVPGTGLVAKWPASDVGPAGSLRIYDRPCENAAVRHVMSESRKYLKDGVLTWAGKKFATCWIELPGIDGRHRVFSRDENRERLEPILVEHFKDDGT